MRIVFMGTPAFATPSLRALAAGHDVTLAVTRPDAVRGRGRTLVPSPVKEVALGSGIDVAEAYRVDDSLIERIARERPDVICVAAYGALLPDALLEVAPLGCVNVHASLLPRWRGAAPIQRAILLGDERAGVSIMRIVHELDAGPYCRQASVEVGAKPCMQVMDELAELGAQELVRALGDMASGSCAWVEQDEASVCYAAKVTKADMALDPALDAVSNARRVQASTDAAPARAMVAGKGLRVLGARMSEGAVAPGEVELRGRRGVALGCADGVLELLEVKPDGKRAMPVVAWMQGLRNADLTWGRA